MTDDDDDDFEAEDEPEQDVLVEISHLASGMNYGLVQCKERMEVLRQRLVDSNVSVRCWMPVRQAGGKTWYFGYAQGRFQISQIDPDRKDPGEFVKNWEEYPAEIKLLTFLEVDKLLELIRKRLTEHCTRINKRFPPTPAVVAPRQG